MRCLLWAMILASAPAWAQSGSQLVADLVKQGIPAEDAGVENGVAIARVLHGSSTRLGVAETQRQMLEVFSALAATYPSADMLMLASYVGDQAVSRAGIDAQSVRAWRARQISEADCLARVQVNLLLDIEKTLASAAPAREQSTVAPDSWDEDSVALVILVALAIVAVGAIGYGVVRARRGPRPRRAPVRVEPVAEQVAATAPPNAATAPSSGARRVTTILMLGAFVAIMLSVAGAESDAREDEAPWIVGLALLAALVAIVAAVLVWRRKR